MEKEENFFRDAKCPFGHQRIIEVPIVYGLLGTTPNQKKDELAVWCGGCITQTPKTKFVCNECGYVYEPAFQSWVKNSGETEQFLYPLSKLIAKFPKPLQGYYFEQAIKQNKLYFEKIYYWTEQQIDAIKLEICNYLTNNFVKISEKKDYLESESEDHHSTIIQGIWEDRFLQIVFSLQNCDNNIQFSLECNLLSFEAFKKTGILRGLENSLELLCYEQISETDISNLVAEISSKSLVGQLWDAYLLSHLGKTDVVKSFFLLGLQDTDENIKILSLYLLGSLGKQTSFALSTIENCIKDKNLEISYLASRVLNQIRD